MSNPSQPVHAPSARSHRFHMLDALRGLAAAVVAIYHMPLFAHEGLPITHGWLAVDFFFALSGFVIAYSYQQRLAAGLGLRDFLAARLIRLYPLYLAGTLLGVAANLLIQANSAHIHFSPFNFFTSLPFALLVLPNFPNHSLYGYTFPFNIAGWSLFYELVANVAFALLVRARLAGTVVVALLVVVSATIFLFAIVHGDSLDVGSTIGTLMLGDVRVTLSFLLGVLVYRLHTARPNAPPRFVGTVLYPVVATLGLLAILVSSSPWLEHASAQLAIVLLIFPALIYVGARSLLPGASFAACALLGELSYPLYILHAPLVMPLGGSKPAVFLLAHPAIYHSVLALVLIGLFVLSWLAVRFYDRPLRRWLTVRYNAATLKEKLHA